MDQGEAIRTLFRPWNQWEKEIEIARATRKIDTLLAQGSNYDRARVTEILVGEWQLQTEVLYGQNWEKIISLYLFDHVAYADGLSPDTFVFSANGSYLRHLVACDPTIGDGGYIENRGEWQFDPATEELVFTGEYKNRIKIKALTDSYFAGDYAGYDNRSLRAVYERR